jgi:hypothetical protein
MRSYPATVPAGYARINRPVLLRKMGLRATHTAAGRQQQSHHHRSTPLLIPAQHHHEAPASVTYPAVVDLRSSSKSAGSDDRARSSPQLTPRPDVDRAHQGGFA